MKNNILIPLAFTVFTGTAAGMEKPLKELNKQLIHAAKVGDTDMVAQLLEKQKKEDDEKKSSEITNLLRTGRSKALHRATKNDNSEVIELLLAHDLNVNVENGHGQTPLHMAAWAGHLEIIKLLLAHPDIDVNKQNSLGWTPLYWATVHNKPEVVKLLLDHPNAVIDIAAIYGRTPLENALAADHGEILALLFKHTVPNNQTVGYLKELSRDQSTYLSLLPQDMVIGACALYQRNYSITDEQLRKIAEQQGDRNTRAILRNELRKRALAHEAIKKSVTIKKRKKEQ